MRSPRPPANEEERQAAVDEVLLTHPELEEAFDLATHLVQTRLNMAASVFTVVDRDRQYFVSKQGLSLSETPRDISFCGNTILQDDIFIVPDALCDEDFSDNPLVTEKPSIRFYAGIPVRAPNGQIIGDLAAIDTKPGKLTRRNRDFLIDLGGIVESLVKLLSLSARDHLTNLPNRRYFDEIMGQEWNRACRARLPLALLYIDLDDFKAYNDTYGHQAGDECLRKLADTLDHACKRSGDVPFRVGGEEFAILLAMTGDDSGAFQFAEELHREIAELAIAHKGSPSGRVTISIGIAVAGPGSLPTDGSRLSEFIGKSDEALYDAKKSGKNTTVVRNFV